MPRSSGVSGWVPVPNILIDRVMPRLNDTEWRVLLVIVRQTFGWRQGESHKRSDWISHYQFKRRTGRHSSAVSRAIDVLERSGLIEVSDRAGELLHSAAERRRSRSRLQFSLARSLESNFLQLRVRRSHQRISQSRNNKTKPNKRKTTTDKSVKRAAHLDAS